MTSPAATHIGTRDIPLDELRPHPDNPNRGDVDAIAESLGEFGQYRSVVALTDGTILAGHHVVEALRQRGATHARVDVIDTDPQTAKRILLADNRIADLGEGLDDTALLDLLQSLDGDLTGTGYLTDDLDDLIAAAEEAANTAAQISDDFGRTDGTGINSRKDAYEESDARMVVLQYSGDDYVTIVEGLAELAEAYDTDSNAATVARLITDALATLGNG